MPAAIVSPHARFAGLFVLLAACPQVSIVGTASAKPVAVPEILASYTDTHASPIVVDGVTTDWTEQALAHSIEFFPGDGRGGAPESPGTTVVWKMDGKEDGHVRVTLTHDGDSIYLLAVIRDDHLEQRPADKNTNPAFLEDGLHVYFDSANARVDKAGDTPLRDQPGFEQFGVSTDYSCTGEGCDFTTDTGPEGWARPGAQPDQKHWLVGIGIRGSGPYTYVFEERFPMREVPGHNLKTMLPGRSYGFNLEFVDSDRGNYLEGYMFWSSDGKSDAFIDLDLYGRLKLEALPPSHPKS
ncbi:MAG: hypothetical protein HUU16_13820 [Candidatus Omnitrophica bacterium]|nr:hypothetical protein [Candidatus Omnitrophota bacterium]